MNCRTIVVTSEFISANNCLFCSLNVAFQSVEIVLFTRRTTFSAIHFNIPKISQMKQKLNGWSTTISWENSESCKLYLRALDFSLHFRAWDAGSGGMGSCIFVSIHGISWASNIPTFPSFIGLNKKQRNRSCNLSVSALRNRGGCKLLWTYYKFKVPFAGSIEHCKS